MFIRVVIILLKMKNLFDIMLGPPKKKDDHKARTDLNFSNELAKGIKK